MGDSHRFSLSSPVGPIVTFAFKIKYAWRLWPLPTQWNYLLWMCVALLFRRRAFQTNMEKTTCVVAECYEDPCFFYSVLDDWDSTSKCIYWLSWVSIKVFWWFPLFPLQWRLNLQWAPPFWSVIRNYIWKALRFSE